MKNLIILDLPLHSNPEGHVEEEAAKEQSWLLFQICSLCGSHRTNGWIPFEPLTVFNFTGMICPSSMAPGDNFRLLFR